MFDSFEGLPDCQKETPTDSRLTGDYKEVEWHGGTYAVRLGEVEDNVSKHGELERCRFFRGWFKDTLIDGNLPEKISFAFTDVDLADSARDCMKGLWERLDEGSFFFSHDASFLKAVLEITEVNKSCAGSTSVFYGAGYGMGDAAENLGFLLKGVNDFDEHVSLLNRCILH